MKPRPLAQRLLDSHGRRFADPRSHFSPRHRQRGFIINPFWFSSGVVPEALSIYNALVAWWSMDDNAATTAVADATGHGHAAVSAGASNTNTFSSATAKYGRSMLMTNAAGGAGIYVPRTDTAFDFGDVDFSIGLWFRFAAYNTFSGGFTIPIFGRWNASTFNYGLSNSRDSSSRSKYLSFPI